MTLALNPIKGLYAFACGTREVDSSGQRDKVSATRNSVKEGAAATMNIALGCLALYAANQALVLTGYTAAYWAVLGAVAYCSAPVALAAAAVVTVTAAYARLADLTALVGVKSFADFTALVGTQNVGIGLAQLVGTIALLSDQVKGYANDAVNMASDYYANCLDRQVVALSRSFANWAVREAKPVLSPET